MSSSEELITLDRITILHVLRNYIKGFFSIHKLVSAKVMQYPSGEFGQLGRDPLPPSGQKGQAEGAVKSVFIGREKSILTFS